VPQEVITSQVLLVVAAAGHLESKAVAHCSLLLVAHVDELLA